MDNKWLKLAVVSFVGILVSVFGLAFVQAFAGQGGHAGMQGYQTSGAVNQTGTIQTGVSHSGMTQPGTNQFGYQAALGTSYSGLQQHNYNSSSYEPGLSYQLNAMRQQMLQMQNQMMYIRNSLNNMNTMNGMSSTNGMGSGGMSGMPMM